MNRKSNIENGLHRPFNKPLKSLIWVCKFCNQQRNNPSLSLYIDFYLQHLHDVVTNSEKYPKNKEECEGLINPQTAKDILRELEPLEQSTIKDKIRDVLQPKKDKSDFQKRLYSTYKNTSYYLTLAKNFGLINNQGIIQEKGRSLILRSSFYELSLSEKLLLFSMIFRRYGEIFILLVLSKKDQTKLCNDEKFLYQLFYEYYGIYRRSKYVTSFDKNYIEVINAWIVQLDIVSINGIRSKYMRIIDANDNLKKIAIGVQKQYTVFIKDIMRPLQKKLELLNSFEDAYKEVLKKKGDSLSFVNLYDIMSYMHKSFSTFNKILNDYYKERKKNEIILFSNLVESIDRRPRFIIEGRSVIKMKIIKKNKYAIQ